MLRPLLAQDPGVGTANVESLFKRGMTCTDSIILKPGLGLSLLTVHSTGQGWKIMIIQSLVWLVRRSFEPKKT